MNLKWLVFAAALLIVGVLPIGWVSWEYSTHLGGISKKPEDWGAFGSLLGGLFTYLAAVGTISTLILLFYQQHLNEQSQKRHERLLMQQISVLAFDQYKNHRQLFFEKLDEISNQYSGKIFFPDRDRVYHSIFHMNNPAQTTFAIPLNEEAGTRYHDLSDCVAKYKTISNLLDNFRNGRNALDLVLAIADLNDCLGVAQKGDPEVGEVLFYKTPTGFNIDHPDTSIELIERVINEILYFSSNESLEQIHQKAQIPHIKDQILKMLKTGKYSQFEIVE